MAEKASEEAPEVLEAPEAPQARETVEPQKPSAAFEEARPTIEDPVKEVEAPAPQSAPEAKTETSSSGPSWPELAADHPLAKFCSDLKAIRDEIGHNEVYGIDISNSNSFHTKLILQKFLRANADDLDKAKEQLQLTLQWRKEFRTLEQVKASHGIAKFGGLGYVTVMEGVPESPNEKDVVTFNIYGAVDDNKKTFGDIEEYVEKYYTRETLRNAYIYRFLRWRVALMELSLHKLNLKDATQPIPDYGKGPDPYQGIQIHDYLNISFLRQDPVVKAASSKTIETFSKYYPETLSRKFFVNVPAVMGWLYTAIKLVLPRETVKKFTVMSYGNQLFKELGLGVPEIYGGKGSSLEEMGEQTILQ